MGRTAEVGEDATLTSILAANPPLDIALDLLLARLGRQADTWYQEVVSLRRAADTPAGVVSQYEQMLNRLQKLLSKVSALASISSGTLYKRNAVQELEELRAWAKAALLPSDPLFTNALFFETRASFARTLLDILDEFM